MIEKHHELMQLTFSNQGGIFGSATEYIDDVEEIIVRNGLLREFISDEAFFTPEAKGAYDELEQALAKVAHIIRAASR